MPVTMTIKDERTVRCPVPASADDTQALATFLEDCVREGYILKYATAIEGGSQRDPITTAVQLIFERSN